MDRLCCDIAIIGAGSGGLSLAAGAAQLGLRVILCERDKMGGDCLNRGCIPSKALLAAAKRHWQALNSEPFGTIIERSHLDFTAVMNHVQKTIDAIAPHDSVERFERLGVTVVQAQARFKNSSTLIADNREIYAKRIVIATGSAPAIPPIKNLSAVAFLTNETIFNLKKLPQHLVVIGGGPIGCELAQAFSMLGAKVSLIEGLSLLNKDDKECVKRVEASLKHCGINIYQKTAVERVEQTEQGVTVWVKHNHDIISIKGSHLLVATGRKPNVADLSCEKAGVEFDDKGIKVNQKLQTRNKKIYAMGDVLGQWQFTHAANYHASILIKNIIFKLSAKADYSSMPWVTYTHPELAHVGLTEKQCEQLNSTYIVHELPYQDNDRALAEGFQQGKIKCLITPQAKVLGVTIVGVNAGELIAPWGMLIREKKSLRALTDLTIAYPTLNELSKQVASQHFAPKLFSPRVKRLARLLFKLPW